MKKIVFVLLVIMLLFSAALSETDLSSMPYNDLIAMQKKLNAEIMSRPEWKQVTVPAGTWYTGSDIPVGYYSITSTDDLSIVRLADKDNHFIFYKTMSENEVAGKVYFEPGSVLTIYDTIILAPPLSLGF